MEPILLTDEEAAALLAISKTSFRRDVLPRLEKIRLTPKTVRYRRRDVLALIGESDVRD